MSASSNKSPADCARPTWVNLVFERRGVRLSGFSAAMHGLPRICDQVEHVDDSVEFFGRVSSVCWSNTTDGSFKATVRVEVPQ